MHFGKNANKSRSSEPFHMWIYEMKPIYKCNFNLQWNLFAPAIHYGGERDLATSFDSFIFSRARQNWSSFFEDLGVGHGKLKMFVLCRLGRPWETETCSSFCACLVGHGKLKLFIILCRLRGRPWETETVHHFVQAWGSPWETETVHHFVQDVGIFLASMK